MPRKPIGGCVDEASRADVVYEQGALASAEVGDLAHRRFSSEAHDLEVARVAAEDSRSALTHCGLVVGQAGLVRAPHFDQRAAALADYVRQPERAADLYHLAPREDHFPSICKRVQAQ